MSLTVQSCHVQDGRASPNRLSEEDGDSCSADDDPKDPAEDSDSESGSGSDNHGDWAPLYRPHLSSHDNQPPLKAQLSDTERAGPQDRGDNTREEGGGGEQPDLCVFVMNVM